METEFRLPDLGEGIHEGEVIEVLVSPGDAVKDGQTFMVVETDKAATEIPAPVTGIVREVKVKAGDMVQVGDVLVTFSGKEDGIKPQKPAVAAEKTEKKSQTVSQPVLEAKEGGPVPAAPAVRRLARELGVDLRQVPPSGPGGRVLAEDVRSVAEKGTKAASMSESEPVETEAVKSSTAQAPVLPDFSQWGLIERVPLRSVRRATAKRMALAWSQIPHVTHSDEADVTDLEAMRRKHKSDVEARGGKLTLTIFALKAAVAALKAFPYFNATLDMDAQEIILKQYYHIGVAVDTDRGLLVPVLRNVDCKSITDLAKELYALADRTRTGLADIKDMTGGTFTISNVGSMGGISFTPIINFPQVAILGLGKTRLRPVVKGTADQYEIVPRLMLPLSLAFDHRIVDGADAARFMNIIIETMENPEKLVMLA